MPPTERPVRVKLLVQYCGPRGSHTPGTVIDLPPGEAKGLLDGRHAELYTEAGPAREIRGGSKSDAGGPDPERRDADDIDDIDTAIEAKDEGEPQDAGDESIDDTSSKPAAPKHRGGKRR